jgi:hypothetical protein
MIKSSEAESELLSLSPGNCYVFSFLVMMGWTPGRVCKLSLHHCVQTHCNGASSLVLLGVRSLSSQEEIGGA